MKNGLLKIFLYTWLISLILVGIIYLVFGSKTVSASGSLLITDPTSFPYYTGSAPYGCTNGSWDGLITPSGDYLFSSAIAYSGGGCYSGSGPLFFDISNQASYGMTGKPSGDYTFMSGPYVDIGSGALSTSDFIYYSQYYWDGSNASFYPPPDYTSHFNSISFSTTTNKVNVTGYWNATTTPNIIEQVSFNQYSIMLGEEANATTIATTTGNFNLYFDYIPLPTPYTGATTTATITSDLFFNAKLYQIDNNYYNPFGEQDIRYSTLLDATSTVLTASTTDLWNIGSTTAGLFLYPEYICDITSITGCIKNALIWAFYPTQKTVENFYNLQTLVQSKAPFGYFSVVKTGINSLSATSTPTFSITIPNSLKIYIFNPFDIAISSILWLFFIFNLYKRLKHITI